MSHSFCTFLTLVYKRQFLSCPKPLFQSEAKRKGTDMKKNNFFILMQVNKNYSLVEALFVTVLNREPIFLLTCASLASLRGEWHFLISRV